MEKNDFIKVREILDNNNVSTIDRLWWDPMSDKLYSWHASPFEPIYGGSLMGYVDECADNHLLSDKVKMKLKQLTAELNRAKMSKINISLKN